MKTTWLFFSLCVCVAQVGLSNPSDTYRVIERGPHHQVWERVEQELRTDGRSVARVRSYTELASGMHYVDTDGELRESKEEIEIVPGGAVARQGQHKVIFAANLNTVGAIDMETPDGKRLQSTVLGLCYYDSSSDKSVVIAEVKDSEGEVFGNQVLYANAFNDMKADVRYTYTRAGFEQDIILREQPPGPEAFGLNPATTTLQVMTEFLNPPRPRKLPAGSREGDVVLDFGATRISHGKAFLIGDEENGVPVKKQWLETGGRSVLIEGVPLATLDSALRTLPKTALLNQTNAVHTASTGRVLPKPRLAKAGSTEMKLAKSSAPAPGLVLDYVTLNAWWLGDYALAGGVTYYVTGPFLVAGTLTIEGGTCVKVAENSYGGVIALNGVKCETSLYRPAIFTSKNDNSVGETISGSSGSPSTYNCTALMLDVGTSLPGPIENLHIRYAATGLEYWQGQTVPPVLRHCQFVNVGDGIRNYSDPLTVENALFSGVSGNVFAGSWYSTFSATHLTVHDAGALTASSTPLTVANSLFVDAPDGSGSVTKTDCDSPSATVFTTTGAGNYYVENEDYRFGQVSGSVKLLADFRRMTTYPPTEKQPQTISSAATWNQTVARGTSIPWMIGYHYPALDYLVSQINVQNTTLTLGEGVTVATYGNIGFHTSTGGGLVTHGNALNHNQLCFYPAVQEQPTKLNGVLPNTILSWYGGYSQPSVMDARFTDFNGMAGMLNLAYGYVFQCQLRDCRLGPGRFEPESPNTFESFINNLFERATLRVGTFDFICPLDFYNNTVRYSTVQIDNDWWQNGYRTIRDNLFDHSTNNVAYPQYVVHDHNAYRASATSLTLGGTDITLSSLTYADGPLGNRYIASSSPTLVDTGSRTASTAGLEEFTIKADNSRDTGTVDVGFHYWALALCGEGSLSSWQFTDQGFIGPDPDAPLSGGFRAYTDPANVTASPWSFPETANCVTSSPTGILLRMNFEKDDSCEAQHGGPSNPNRQIATAEAVISVGCPTRLKINWCGLAERQAKEFELMTLYVGDALLADAQAPGGGQGCAGGMGAAVPRRDDQDNPILPPPQERVLSPGFHILRIKTDTKDALYHFGAYYEFEVLLQPQ